MAHCFSVCHKASKVEELMAALKKKDDDMRAMEERYKMYLEKARNVSDQDLPFSVRACEYLKHKVHRFSQYPCCISAFSTATSPLGNPSTGP